MLSVRGHPAARRPGVFATSASNNASATVGAYTGKGLYVVGYAAGRSTDAPLRSKDTASKSYENVSVQKT